ncbi:MAG: M91 family zinc metallopeptidase [Candidatus Methylophosphatis roskildensis]
MGNSKHRIHGFGDQLSPLTPGPWGHNDAGDPNAKRAVLGDKPGSTGMFDAGVAATGGSVCEPYQFVRRSINDVPLLKLQRDEWYADGGLSIRGNDDFIGATRGHLGQIKATRCGALLLEKLRNLAGRKVHGLRFVILSEDGGRSAEALNKPDAYPKGKQIEFWTDASRGGRSCFTGTGVGSDVVIHHNHTLHRNEDGQDVPPAIGLAHELVHAWHQAAGTLATGWKDNVWNYERQSVGIGEYARCAGGCSGHVTENCIRSQWSPKLKPRMQYGGEAKGLEPDF